MSRSALAWHTEGHEVIDRAALSVMPKDVPEFFRKGEAAILAGAMDPDLWRAREMPALKSGEDPNHFFDLELLAGRKLPPTRAQFGTLCRELKVWPDQVGTLPYAIQEWHDRLVIAFAEHRAWPESEAIRAKVLYTAAVLSHYTGDASQPLHCTIHYDGRANKDGSSPRSGVHAQMDALPGQVGLEAWEVARDLEPVAVTDVMDFTLEAIRASNARVGRVYALEDKLPPADEPPDGEPDAAVGALALDCCRAGATLTATVWYSAWAASARVTLPPWHEPNAE